MQDTMKSFLCLILAFFIKVNISTQISIKTFYIQNWNVLHNPEMTN